MTQRSPFIIASLLATVLLWGVNNVAVKILVRQWPPIWVGATRFIAAGALLLWVLRWIHPPRGSKGLERELWLRGGLSLACYVACFNWAVHFTSPAHVALQIGVSPVWALLWEWRPPERSRDAVKHLTAAGLALAGVLVLFWPALHGGGSSLWGELLALASGLLWTNYGRQSKRLGASISGLESSAQSMWRAGLLLLPLGLLETRWKPLVWDAKVVSVQAYCVVFGAVIAFALWNNALRHWKTSEVYLFNNLIPLSTMLSAHFILGEPITSTFGIAMVLVVAGVFVGQSNWRSLREIAGLQRLT